MKNSGCPALPSTAIATMGHSPISVLSSSRTRHMVPNALLCLSTYCPASSLICMGLTETLTKALFSGNSKMYFAISYKFKLNYIIFFSVINNSFHTQLEHAVMLNRIGSSNEIAKSDKKVSSKKPIISALLFLSLSLAAVLVANTPSTVRVTSSLSPIFSWLVSTKTFFSILL